MIKAKFIRIVPVIIVALVMFSGGLLFECAETKEIQTNYQSENGTTDKYLLRSLKEQRWSEVLQESNIYVDLIFLIDGSGSVSEYNFKTIMNWINNVSASFTISSGIFQIGVVQYSHWYRTRSPKRQKFIKTEIQLGQCRNKSCLNEELENIQYMGYTTFTGAAINKTVNQDFLSSKHSHKASKIMVLVTDGGSMDDTEMAAKHARAFNITIFSVGVGKADLDYELQLIANGELYNNLRVYKLDTYDKLPTIVSSLQSEIKSSYFRPVCPPLLTPKNGELTCTDSNNVGSTCTVECDVRNNFILFGSENQTCQITSYGLSWTESSGTCGVCDEKFDLLFILDSSSSITKDNFILMKRFVSILIDSLIIGPENVQVSCMRYNSVIYDVFTYKDYQTKRSLIKNIKTIEYSGKGTATAKALRYAEESKVNSEIGRRHSLPHITVVITDGESINDIADSAAKLKKISKVIAIGLVNARQGDINLMSSDPELSQPIMRSFKQLMNITIVRNTLMKFCNAVKKLRSTTCKAIKSSRGFINCTDTYQPVGTICSLTCNPGYFTTNKQALATCDYNSEWSKTPSWRCIEKSCPQLKSTAGIAVTCFKGNRKGIYRIGAVCLSRCKPGYADVYPGENSKYCEEIGEFRRCNHSCERNYGSDPTWDSGLISCRYTGECNPAICGANGYCKSRRDATNTTVFLCECNPGYKGAFCETNINECSLFSVKCSNGGKCVDLVNNYVCECEPGFTGRHCEEDINECEFSPCNSHINCTDKSNDCKCPTEKDDKDCQYDGGKCWNSTNCGSICTNTFGGFYCEYAYCPLHKLETENGINTCTDNEVIEGSVCELSCPDTWELIPQRIAEYVTKSNTSRPAAVNSTVVTCDSNGKWSNSLNNSSEMSLTWGCKPITCLPLEDLSLGGNFKILRADLTNVSALEENVHLINCTNGTNVGSVCSIQCHESFGINYDQKRTCQLDGSWTGRKWRCFQKKCLKPHTTGESYRLECTGNSMNAGSTCKLICGANSENFGASFKKCNQKFLWEPNQQWGCRIKCSILRSQEENGEFSCSDGQRPGSVCTMRCFPGFILDGSGKMTCTKSGTKMIWLGNTGTCKRSECDYMLNLMSGKSSDNTSAGFVTQLRQPYRHSSELDTYENEPVCNMKSSLVINITENEVVSIQLWYGKTLSSFHTVLSTSHDTNGNNAILENNERLLTGHGAQLVSSGFPDDGEGRERLPVIIEPNSRVNLLLSSKVWEWRSKGIWQQNHIRKNISENFTNALVNQHWYSVYLGLNRVPTPTLFYDLYYNGTGLCYVCIQRNHTT